jgi:hypothetical protein
MGWKSHGPRSTDSKYSGQLSANLPPAVAACILASPESALFLSAQNPGLSRSYALNNYDYPCQTWLPQLHVTVSVGCCLVNCFLQMGHGLVITYVMVFYSQAESLDGDSRLQVHSFVWHVTDYRS